MLKRVTIVSLMLLSASLAFGQEKTEKLKTSFNGRFYLDGTAFFKDKTHLGSGATISDIRLGVKGSYEKFQGKLDVGFAKKTISLKDVFIEYDFQKNSYVRAGHFAEPLGIDYMESSANIKFISPGCVTEAFAPGRKLGLEYVGWCKNFWYAGGIFGDTHFAERLNYTGNDGYAFTGRGVYNPFREEGCILHLGLAASFRVPDATKDGQAPRSISYGSTLGSMVNSTKFVNAEVSDARNSVKFVGEFIGAIDRFCLQAEYFNTRVNRHDNLEQYKAWGTYGQVGFLAIGTGYTYADQWARLDIPAPGSLEFVARYSVLDLNNSKSGIQGGEQQQLTVACNYYWKKFITLRLNYDYARLDQYALNGKEHFNFISARVQVYF